MIPLLLVVLSACRDEPMPATPVAPPVTLELDAVDHAVRASLSLRGLRPTEAELDALLADPEALVGLVEQWSTEPAFGETVKDLHAELFLVRTDTTYQLPVMGLLTARGYDQADLHHSTVEAPLELVREVVAEGRPYGDILTADYTLADAVVADVYGLPYDRSLGGWQRTRWVDGRPQSGLLSDSELWRRHVSNAANFHRGRANFVSRTFLCEDIGGRDVFVDGGVDISDELAVARAVSTDPGCVACHSVLDPLSAFFWGYKEQLKRGAILAAYDVGCEWEWENGEPPRGAYRVEHWCYPLKFYDVDEREGWATWGLKPPGYFGTPARDVRDLGWMIREDPRFAQCTARNVWGWMSQTRPQDAPPELVTELAEVFESSNQSFAALARAVVLHPAFATVDALPGGDGVAPPSVGLLSLRPEAWSRAVQAITGFTWWAQQDEPGCASEPNTCWGASNLATTDRFGFRAMFGGVDGTTVTHPIHTPTPTKVMALQLMSQEAAGYVVDADLALPDPSARRLLREVEAGTVDDAAVRAQLVALHRRVLTHELADDDPVIEADLALWRSVVDGGGTPATAWKVVVAALLQDPRMVLY